MSQSGQHRTLSSSLGGDVAAWIDDVSGETYECPLCGSTTTAIEDAEIRAFPHLDGIADEDNNRWWPYIRCPDCEFELTYDLFSEYRRD